MAEKGKIHMMKKQQFSVMFSSLSKPSTLAAFIKSQFRHVCLDIQGQNAAAQPDTCKCQAGARVW